MTVRVEVVKQDGLEVVESLPADSKSDAEAIQRGILINLNHEDYFTRIVD